MNNNNNNNNIDTRHTSVGHKSKTIDQKESHRPIKRHRKTTTLTSTLSSTINNPRDNSILMYPIVSTSNSTNVNNSNDDEEDDSFDSNKPFSDPNEELQVNDKRPRDWKKYANPDQQKLLDYYEAKRRRKYYNMQKNTLRRNEGKNKTIKK